MTDVAIVGYGRVGNWALEKAENEPDVEPVGIVSRRSEKLQDELDCPVSSDVKDIDPDVSILATETGYLFDAAPEILKTSHIVDSFDKHSRMKEYFELLDENAKKNGKTALYAHGWDPGFFSQMRLSFEAVFPKGETKYEYGIGLENGGVSRGHSSELNRRFDDRVELAVSRTFPKNEKGENVREVTIAPKSEIDREKLKEDIMVVPYFKGDDVTFRFEDRDSVEDYFTEEHSGHVLREGEEMNDIQEQGKFELILYSNPAFTAQVLVRASKAAEEMLDLSGPGAYNMTDIPPKFYSRRSDEEIVEEII